MSKVAYMSYPANQTTAALNGTEEFPAGLLAANPEISLLIAASEVGLDGTYGSSGYSDYIAYEHFTVSDQVDDAKLIKVLQFFEYTTSKQGRYTYSYGTEGKTWKYNEQGKPAFVDNVKDILGNDGDTIWKQSGTFRQFICDEFYLEWCNDVQFKTIGKYAIGKDAIWCANMKHTYRSDPYNSTILAELEAKNNPNIEQYVKEYVASVVSGTANIDSTWDQYMTTINGLGYTEIKAALQKCPLTDEIRG